MGETPNHKSSRKTPDRKPPGRDFSSDLFVWQRNGPGTTKSPTSSSLENMLQAYQTEIDNTAENDANNKVRLYGIMGLLCQRHKDNKTAIVYFTKQLHIAQQELNKYQKQKQSNKEMILHWGWWMGKIYCNLGKANENGSGTSKLAASRYMKALSSLEDASDNFHRQVASCLECDPSKERTCQFHSHWDQKLSTMFGTVMEAPSMVRRASEQAETPTNDAKKAPITTLPTGNPSSSRTTQTIIAHPNSSFVPLDSQFQTPPPRTWSNSTSRSEKKGSKGKAIAPSRTTATGTPVTVVSSSFSDSERSRSKGKDHRSSPPGTPSTVGSSSSAIVPNNKSGGKNPSRESNSSERKQNGPPFLVVLVWLLLGLELAFDLLTSGIAVVSLTQSFECCGEPIDFKAHGGRLLGILVPFFVLLYAEIAVLLLSIKHYLSMTPRQRQREAERQELLSERAWFPFLGKTFSDRLINFLFTFNPFFGFFVAYLLLYNSSRMECFLVMGLEAGSVVLHFASVWMEGLMRSPWAVLWHFIPVLPLLVTVYLILEFMDAEGVCYFVKDGLFLFTCPLGCANGTLANEDGLCPDGMPGYRLGEYCPDNTDENFCYFGMETNETSVKDIFGGDIFVR